MENTVTPAPVALPEFTLNLVEKLAFAVPDLGELSPAQAEAVAKAVLGDFLKDKMKTAVLSARIDLTKEIGLFLADQRSDHTRRAYRSALLTFQGWLTSQGLHPAELTPGQADGFIRDQRALGKDADTVRLRVSSISSFYSFLERRYSEVRNPFRGTRARPKSTWTTATIPSPTEITTMIESADPKTKVAIAILAETGLRVGALAELRIKADGTFTTVSKGSRVVGFESLTPETRSMIREAGLSASMPFNPEHHHGHRGRAGTPSAVTNAISARITALTRALAKKGVITTAYSPHDLRHAFAEANASKGLMWLKERLGHATIGVTEHYLRNSLGVSTVDL
jgi:integrase